jgi:hypothetical protein
MARGRGRLFLCPWTPLLTVPPANDRVVTDRHSAMLARLEARGASTSFRCIVLSGGPLHVCARASLCGGPSNAPAPGPC